MNTSEDSYFGKIIILILLAIAAFYGFKTALPPRLFPDQVTSNSNIVMDSMMLEAVSDTTEMAIADTTEVAVRDTLNNNQTEEVDETLDPSIRAQGYNNLKHFYAKLHALEQDKTGKVRVAYFGDSMNDGDYIVQDVRSEFQDNYGGQGVGFVAITSLSANARGSVSHQHSKTWTTQSFVKVKKPARPFGIDGQVFFAHGEGNWVKYRAQSQRHSTSLFRPTLFYGRSANNQAYVTIQSGKDSIVTKELNPTKLLNTLPVASTTKSLQVNFHKTDSIPIYGFNFDDGQGVHVDNYSMRGNSGLPLSILNVNLMNAFDDVLNYDLVVLHYGANVLGYGTLNYSWYEKNMTKVVENLRACFPNADILIISTADKATKIDGVMQTDPAVVPLANAQKNYARKTGAGFISLYSLMGGEGSMAKWVDEKNLAGKDYTHFNATGSKKVAKLIYDEIGKGFSKYKEEHLNE
ncbi:GDSL-type esterase/lipase family protein [Dysgonomonas sp. ZJ709]|uniref:GDSL-type esterase/lipase family protein n=1 Tax=Dysgonomonas sp. ZJ709 TaxID=2709797 RepID=UPI002104FE73|nr:GDSL-type esterase/lipase family protein [Dysgonomonas sp. ZJ709]